ncbi:MAG TPA: hypothetical protein VI111_09935, partial [Thermoleophilaceae bacterium]
MTELSCAQGCAQPPVKALSNGKYDVGSDETLLRIRTSDSLTLTVFGVKLHEWRRFPAPLVGGIMPTLQQLFRRKPVPEM